jgi:hypothetical protein
VWQWVLIERAGARCECNDEVEVEVEEVTMRTLLHSSEVLLSIAEALWESNLFEVAEGGTHQVSLCCYGDTTMILPYVSDWHSQSIFQR